MMMASVAGIFVLFAFMVYSIVSGSMSILLTIFLFIGLFILLIVLITFFALGFARPAFRGSNIEEMTKACGACGHTINITDLSCPKCMTIQSGLQKK
jgi:hypothetical protein